MNEEIKKVIETYAEVKSIRKTAELTGYSKSGVHYLLTKNNITLFPRNRKGNENSSSKAILLLEENNPRRLIRNQEYMKSLYIDKKMSTSEIAKLLGLHESTVFIGLRKCNILKRTLKDSLKGKERPNSQGSKNHNWKGGLSGWRKLSRGRLNEHFVRPIMERDNFTCQWCESKKNIVVHHHKRTFMQIVNLVREKIEENKVEEFVSAIVNEHTLDDGITLCKVCHDKFHWPKSDTTNSVIEET